MIQPCDSVGRVAIPIGKSLCWSHRTQDSMLFVGICSTTELPVHIDQEVTL